MTSLTPQDQIEQQLEHHTEEHPDHRMFGLTTFLVADAMTFAGFFAAYLTFKAVNTSALGCCGWDVLTPIVL